MGVWTLVWLQTLGEGENGVVTRNSQSKFTFKLQLSRHGTGSGAIYVRLNSYRIPNEFGLSHCYMYPQQRGQNDRVTIMSMMLMLMLA